MGFGKLVYRWRWGVLAFWLGGTAALLYWVRRPDPAAAERPSFLPAYADSRRAVEALSRSFPRHCGLSEAVIVFERATEALTPADFDFIEGVADEVGRAEPSRAGPRRPTGTTVRSPRSVAMPGLPNPLVSPAAGRGQAAIVSVRIPSDFITLRATRVVDRIREVLSRDTRPAGLAVAVTGSASFGRDYAAAAERSHRRTLRVTLAAVVLILLVVYRAPLAAMVPLGAISLAAAAAMQILALAGRAGLHTGTAERIFVFVLLYGAGIDYSLLLMSRYREYLQVGRPNKRAAPAALSATLSAILASAGTDTLGLLMLSIADFGIFRSTGPAVAIALLTALLAAITLVPALVGILGPGIFWPGRRPVDPANPAGGLGIGWRRFWPAVARMVTARPALVLLVAILVLLLPAARGIRFTRVYDALASTKGASAGDVGGAAEGMAMAKRHWSAGEVAPVSVLLVAPEAMTQEQWQELARRTAGEIRRLPGISDVRSLDSPLGEATPAWLSAVLQGAPAPPPQTAPATWPALLARLLPAAIRPPAALAEQARRRVFQEYVSRSREAMRMIVTLQAEALSNEALDAVRRIDLAARSAILATGSNLAVHVAGATAEMIDIRQITRRDFYRVAFLVLLVIFLLVFALLRDAILAAFMVASTCLSYLATLGITCAVFVGLGDQAGLDWKVEVFLFVVMVAVGQDYNIFLAARLAQEARSYPVLEAVHKAVVHTGPVISSCGLIMAATLGSLAAGELQLMTELGFALALGMLIDTFVVRPLLLPAFAALTRRTGRTGGLFG